MKIASLVLFLFCISLHAQKKYTKLELNDMLITETHMPVGYATSTVDDITLNDNFTFIFDCRPDRFSCYTWQQYSGTYQKTGDTIVFKEQYVLHDDTMKFKYSVDTADANFTLSFKSDSTRILRNQPVRFTYRYDFFAGVKDRDTLCTTDANGVIAIPFKNIKNLKCLASLDIKVQTNGKERIGNFSTGHLSFTQYGILPNKVAVTIVSYSTKENVTRITKAVLYPHHYIGIISSHSDNVNVENYSTLQFTKLYSIMSD